MGYVAFGKRQEMYLYQESCLENLLWLRRSKEVGSNKGKLHSSMKADSCKERYKKEIINHQPTNPNRKNKEGKYLEKSLVQNRKGNDTVHDKHSNTDRRY